MSFSNDFFNRLKQAASKASDTFNPLDRDYQRKAVEKNQRFGKNIETGVKTLGRDVIEAGQYAKAAGEVIRKSPAGIYNSSKALGQVIAGDQEGAKESMEKADFSQAFKDNLLEKNIYKPARSGGKKLAEGDIEGGVKDVGTSLGNVGQLGMDVAGTVLPIGAGGAAPTVGKAALAGAKVGAGFGAAQGALDTLKNQDYGNVVGNVVGGGAGGAVLGGGLGAGGKLLSNVISKNGGTLPVGMSIKDVSKDVPELSATQKEITSVIDDAFKGVREKFPQIAKLADENKIAKKATSNATIGLREAGNVLTDHFGGFGGELSTRLEHGVNVNERLQQTTQPILNEIKKITSKASKTSIGKRMLNEKVISALEARDNPGFNVEDFIDNKTEVKTFELAKEFFDSYKVLLQERGIPVKSGYFTHIGDVEDMVQGVARESRLPSDITSGFVKERLKEGSEDISMDLLGVMSKYDSSMRKYLSYDDALKYYDANIDKIPEQYLNRQDSKVGQDYLHKLMKDVINPEATTGAYRKTAKALQTTYSSQLWNNPKSTAQNYMQRFFADAYVGEGKKLASQVKTETKDFIISELRKNETSILDELEGQGAKNSFTKFLKKIDAFQAAERGNWDSSGLKGFLEEISQSPVYRDLRVKGMPVNDAIIESFSNDPKLLAQAFRRGDVLMNTTQIGANKALQPEWFRDKKPILGIPKPFIKQYKRFSIAMVENFKRSFNPQNVRETMILKRNVPEQVEIVDKIRMGEETLRSVDDIIKGVKNKEIPGISKKEATQFRKGIEAEVKTLQEATKNYEKYTGLKAGSALAKIWAASSAIQMINDMVVSAINPDAPEPSVGRAVTYGAPMQGGVEAAANPTGPNNPIQPGFTQEFLGLTSRKTIAKIAPNFIPGVGVVNRMIPGRPVSKLFENLMGVAPKNGKFKNNLNK